MSTDPAIIALVAELPTMQNGQKRRFNLYCECFEWTFNRERRREKEMNFIPPPVSDFIEHVDLIAEALWRHLHPRTAA